MLAFRGFASRETRRRADEVVDLLDVQRTRTLLERWRPSVVTLVGAVNRPTPSAFLNAFSVFRNRRDLAGILAESDDKLLRSAIRLLEEHRFRVVGVHELAPQLLARPGLFTQIAPGAKDLEAVERGFSTLAAAACYGVGQACVVTDLRGLAFEGPEGTDRMLSRVGRMPRLLPGLRPERAGVLVKTAKAGQDLRIDLPVIGPRTIAKAARAGLRGVAVGAGMTLIIDEQRTIGIANRLGLFVLSVEH